LSRVVASDRVVVKRGPGTREEARALAAFRGEGVVRLVEHDDDALVLERVLPGTPLVSVSVADDDEATRIAAGVMRRLWRPPPAGFPTVADWGEGFARHRAAHDGGSGSLDPVLFGRAERLFGELCASQAAPVLLHGDLHHFNVLRGADWLAIDPKGVVGEPCYEPGALLRNPYPDVPSREGTARRLDVLASELGFPRERLREWAFAQAVLSAVWHVEDGDPGAGRRYAMACAERLLAA
jgi:streptomycin 6-kinase